MAKMGGRTERRNVAPRQALNQRGSNLSGWPDSGVLDATDGVVAYGTQGLNHIQVLVKAFSLQIAVRHDYNSIPAVGR
jgi:hypothetical protein